LESNWRWNVFLNGMHGSDWELSARWQTPLGGNYYVVKRAILPFRYWVYRVLPGALPTFFINGLIPVGTRFPFGFPVDPD